MRKDISLTLSFITGALIASGIVLLFTTEKGKAIRANIEQWLKEKGLNLSKTEIDHIMEIIFSTQSDNIKHEE